MRIASLLPAATEIVIALGLDMELVGVTHRCRVPPGLGEVAVLTRPGSGGDELDGGTLFDADPNLVIVGDGGVGTIGARAVESVFADDEDEPPSVLTLAPSSVEGVLNGIVAVGAMTESENAALDIVLGMREQLQRPGGDRGGAPRSRVPAATGRAAGRRRSAAGCRPLDP